MYGTRIPHLSQKNDKYGFVNETEIRIATGMTLVLALFSLFLVLFKGEFDIALILVGLMVSDFLIKVIISPRFSLFGSLVRIFLKKGNEIWVGAVQKRFSWSMGIFLSSFVLFCLLVLGEYIIIRDPNVVSMLQTIASNKMNGSFIVTPMNPAIIACLLCIIFMWCESIVGYCVGCHIYAWLVKKGWMKKIPGQNCINGVCELPTTQK